MAIRKKPWNIWVTKHMKNIKIYKENKMKTLEWPNQSPDLNPIEMLWHDLKKAAHAQKPSHVAEFQQFCKDQWAEFLHSAVKDSLPVIANT